MIQKKLESLQWEVRSRARDTRWQDTVFCPSLTVR